jgi:hypothetical protein
MIGRVTFFIGIHLVLSYTSIGQKIQYKDFIGIWRCYQEETDPTQTSQSHSLEVSDSVTLAWHIGNNELLKYTYSLVYATGGISSTPLTFLSERVNYENAHINAFALLTKYGNDTLKVQWLINHQKPSINADTSKFINTIILVRQKP